MNPIALIMSLWVTAHPAPHMANAQAVQDIAGSTLSPDAAAMVETAAAQSGSAVVTEAVTTEAAASIAGVITSEQVLEAVGWLVLF
ncbi:hypothetical protein [Microcystis aeruginosa]|uniref:Uncharacterized protein n=1 Tax=Microcystis aeruginosa PCC 9443 TaxID=1160281 RepID=I4G0V3_MICAE|nr:hypothetical protein [Microcystis aeruginosa]CCI01564.1 exported hypothetical protein [Microcystis aeruginosa PCC 9443]